MTAPNIVAATDYWYASAENVHTLAAWLNDRDEFGSIDDVLRFFEKPWKWAAEWEHLHNRPHAVSECVVCRGEK